ncbi:MAG: dephospho-CoA kinase [Myxococcota bacterium]
MPLWGLTGGIASGKSTVHKMLAKRGAQLIDADAVYHRLIQPTDGAASPLARRIEERFSGVLNPDGTLNRQALGERVFRDENERRILEQLTHPAVAEAVGAAVQAMQAEGVEHVFYDVPLLYERGLESGMAGVVVVWVPPHIQLERLIQRDGLSAKDAQRRIGSQMPLDEKRERADWVIDNSGSLEDTDAQVEALWTRLSEKMP